MVFTAIALILCTGIVTANLKPDKIPLHDGDVLVDSRNIAVEPEKNEETEEADKADGETAGAGEASGTFEEKRAKLELDRADLIAGYDETIKNSGNNAEKNNAVKQKEKLTGYMEQEVAIEGIILSKNLPESMVIVTESTVTITVDEQDLGQNTVAKICNIVMTETNRTADKIIIQSNY